MAKITTLRPVDPELGRPAVAQTLHGPVEYIEWPASPVTELFKEYKANSTVSLIAMHLEMRVLSVYALFNGHMTCDLTELTEAMRDFK